MRHLPTTIAVLFFALAVFGQEFPLRSIEVNAVDEGPYVDVFIAAPPEIVDVDGAVPLQPAPMVMSFPMGGMSFMPQDTLSIASFPQFADELQIVDDQKQQLRDLNQEIMKARQDMVRSLHSKQTEAGRGGTKRDGRAIHEFMMAEEAKIRDKIEDRINAVLLPHQIKRLEELKFQMQLRNQGAPALAGAQLAKTLGLSDDQRKELQEKQRTKQRELDEQIAKLREQAREEILDEVLTDSQRTTLAELMGDKYELKRPQRPNRLFERVERSNRSESDKKPTK